MANFEQILNNAIAQKGFRISARASLQERLERYVELYAHSIGKELDADEVKAVAKMCLMRNSCDSMEVPSKRSVSTSNNGNIRVTFQTGSHPMVRRSQVAEEVQQGTHSMVRRSQVARR